MKNNRILLYSLLSITGLIKTKLLFAQKAVENSVNLSDSQMTTLDTLPATTAAKQLGLKGLKQQQQSIAAKQRIVEGPEDSGAILGESIKLRCKVENQVGTVSWSKRGFWLGEDRALISYSRYAMVGSSAEGEYDLEIKDVQLSDEDTYQCQITSGGPYQLWQKSKIVKLTVLVPPSPPRFFHLDPDKTVKGREGYPLTSRCLSHGGKPEALVEWYLYEDPEGKRIVRRLAQESPNEILTHNELNDVESTIQFVPESADDGKYLVCATKHPALSMVAMVAAKLKIRSKPKVRVKLNSSHDSLVENGFAVLSCDDDVSNDVENGSIADLNRKMITEEEPQNPVKYQWLIDGRLIDSATHKTLHLAKLNRTLHHKMEYTCRAENDVGQSESTYKLDVTYPPHFKSSFQKFVVSQGETITFTCSVDSNPAPTIYKWTRSGGGRWAPTFGQNLTIENVQRAGEGVYNCEVAVEGFPPVRQTNYLCVKGPPKVVIDNAPDAVEGGSAKIYCKITGYPKPVENNVTWYKGTATITPHNNHRFEISVASPKEEEMYSVLVIKKVLPMDFDLYNCTVRNSIGIGWATTRLVESTNFPMYFMVPGVVGGCVAILFIAMAIVWANRKFICQSKSSTTTTHSDDQSDLTVKMEDVGTRGISLTYFPDLYSSGPMIDSTEVIGSKQTYMAIPQDNPDLDDLPVSPFLHHEHQVSFLPNGSIRHLGANGQYYPANSVTPPPLFSDQSSLTPNGSYILSDLPQNKGGLLINQQQQPYVHQATYVPRVTGSTMGSNIYSAYVPHFSVSTAKNGLHQPSAYCSTFGRYPAMTNGHSMDNINNGIAGQIQGQQHLYRHSPQPLAPTSTNQLYLAPHYQIQTNSGGNLMLMGLEPVPEVTTPEMMDENSTSVYDNNNANNDDELSTHV